MTPVPVISLPKATEAEHFVIHSDVGTPSGSMPGLPRQRRRDNLSRRKPSPTSEGQQRPGSSEKPEPKLESAASAVEPDSARASPTSQLRRENDVLRMQVQALREVQEQTAEIHWQVISDIVAERNLYESRWREAVASEIRPSRKTVSLTTSSASTTTETAPPAPTASSAPAVPPAPRSVPARVYTLTPSLCRRVWQRPVVDRLLRSPTPVPVTSYTLRPSSLYTCAGTPAPSDGRRSPVPSQAAPMRVTSVEQPSVIRSAVRLRSAPVVGPALAKEPTGPTVSEPSLVTAKPLEASKILALPTPCRQGGRARSKDKEKRRCSRCGFEEVINKGCCTPSA